MKFCTNCGTKLNDDDMFCYNCGTKCVSFNAPKEEKKEEVVTPKVDPSIEEKEKAEEAERQEEARLAEEAKQKEEEAKRQAEEARLKAEEEARKKAEEEARLAEERKQKEQRLNEIENKRKEKEAEKDKLNKEDAALKDEENQLRKELNLPIKEEKPTPVKEELIEEKPAPNNKGKAFLLDPDEFNSPTLLFHAVVFFGVLILISLIYWLVGSFTNIHVAVRLVIFFVALGTMVLPLMEAIKLTIYMIKNKKVNLFLIIILSIIQVLSWVFVFLNLAAIF